MSKPPSPPKLHWLSVVGVLAVLLLAMSMEFPAVTPSVRVRGAGTASATEPASRALPGTPGRRPARKPCWMAKRLCCPAYCSCRGHKAKDACSQTFRACARRAGCKKPAASVCRCSKGRR